MRWYIIERQEDCDCQWKITSWSRTRIAANRKAGNDGKVVCAGNRQRAAAIAMSLWDIDLDWKKYDMKGRKP